MYLLYLRTPATPLRSPPPSVDPLLGAGLVLPPEEDVEARRSALANSLNNASKLGTEFV